MSDDDGRDADGATLEEKRPINSVERGEPEENAKVKTRTPRKSGCYLLPGQIAALALSFFILLIGVGVIVWILKPDECDNSDGLGWYDTTPKPTVAPGRPWSNIRLPGSLVPSHYDLELRVDLDIFIFTGSVEIDVLCKSDTYYVILHVNKLTVSRSEVTITDVAQGTLTEIYTQEHVPINQFHVLQTVNSLRAGRKYKIKIGRFEGKLNDDLRGLYRSSYKDQDGNTRFLAASQLQSVDARKVFPCFDEPDLKANFTVALVHRTEYTALSNMPISKSTVLADGWVKDDFQCTPVMSTYLLAFVVADFRSRERATDSGLTIRIWSQPDTFDQTAYALEFAEEAYEFFTKYFNTPEVVPKADHAAIPDFSAGAMENWGLVLYRETALLHDEDVSSISNKYWVSLVMAHEIAHTWFGNMATMKWWDDLWLNEGFANTLMYFALDKIYPEWKVYDLQLVNNIYPVMTKDSLLTSHAISTPIRDPDDIPQFFDSISYDKGMAVLRLLRGFLGWNDFRKGLQTYIEKYKFKNADMKELWKTFTEAVDGKYNVGKIMDTWTRQMGFPQVTVKHLKGNTYRLEQTRFLLNPEDTSSRISSKYGYKWRIPFSYKVQGSNEIQMKWMKMKSAEVHLPPDSWIIGNVDYMGFYRTNYDDSMWRRLIDQLRRDHTVFSASNRAGLISDAFNLARANQLSYEIALNLTSYLTKENDFVPWRAFIDSIHFIKGMLATSNTFGKLQENNLGGLENSSVTCKVTCTVTTTKYIYDIVAPSYRRVGTSDQGDLLDRNLRRTILEAATGTDVPDAVEWAKRSFKSWMDYGTRIPPDYAVVIYAVGVQQGGEKEWNHLWLKSKSTKVASEAEIMMNALAYTQEPWLLWRFARWSLDSAKIRMQDVRNLFRYFASTPLGRSVALQFLLTNWQEINRRFGMDAFLLRDIIYATTSLINTEYEYKQLGRLYRESPPAGVARKAADNSLALIREYSVFSKGWIPLPSIRSNIKWMKLHNETISLWLKANIKDHDIEEV